MDTISKITVTYDETEDRLRLAYQDAEGQSKGLWLTQRLVNRLVGALLASLGAGADIGNAEAALRAWELSAARARLGKDVPVESPPAEQHHLVRAVDISHSGNGIRLVFRGIDAQVAALGIEDETVLRQWLDILHQQYRRADWPMGGLWPAWFKAADHVAAPRPPDMLPN